MRRSVSPASTLDTFLPDKRLCRRKGRSVLTGSSPSHHSDPPGSSKCLLLKAIPAGRTNLSAWISASPRRDFLNSTLLASGSLLMTSLTPVYLVLEDDWTGYSGVGDYSRSNGNTALNKNLKNYAYYAAF